MTTFINVLKIPVWVLWVTAVILMGIFSCSIYGVWLLSNIFNCIYNTLTARDVDNPGDRLLEVTEDMCTWLTNHYPYANNSRVEGGG